MTVFHFTVRMGANLSNQELQAAADLLSKSYSAWQNNPKNLNPVKTDTSPEVYIPMMRKLSHEVILYYEANTLAGVFVHSLSPQYDQYPLRKLSYLGLCFLPDLLPAATKTCLQINSS